VNQPLPSPLLTFLLHPSAPRDALVLPFCAVDQRAGALPKHPTAPTISSRSLLPLLDEDLDEDQALEIITTSGISSWTRRLPKATRAHRRSTTWLRLRRPWRNPSTPVSFSPLLILSVGSRYSDLNRSLNAKG
jgi:hypothetical protein